MLAAQPHELVEGLGKTPGKEGNQMEPVASRKPLSISQPDQESVINNAGARNAEGASAAAGVGCENQQETDSTHDSAVTRRQFLGVAAGASILMSFPWQPRAGEVKGDVPHRTLGRTGERVSAVGIGGYHLGKPELQEPESIRIIRTAIDNGINFLDNCWDYNEGQSEIRMGKALQDGYRQRAFLMTKIDGRDKKTAARQIEESLGRLQTDRIDLLQFHEIIRKRKRGKSASSGSPGTRVPTST